MIDEKPIALRFEAVRPSLDERAGRLHVAAEAHSAGHGGVAATARATGVARSTIGRGLKDLRDATPVHGRMRRPGAGRRKLTAKDPTLLTELEKLLEPATMGDPMRSLRWVSKSHDKLATALCEMGHQVSASAFPSCWRRWATAATSTARPRTAAAIRTAMLSSSASTPRRGSSRPPGSQ